MNCPGFDGADGCPARSKPTADLLDPHTVRQKVAYQQPVGTLSAMETMAHDEGTVIDATLHRPRTDAKGAFLLEGVSEQLALEAPAFASRPHWVRTLRFGAGSA